MSEYKGKTIALISQADIRYVGSLEDIDADKGTISLANVRCLGTEDRILDPAKILYPSPEVYEHFQLTGSSVKTLNILDIPVEQVQPVPVPRVTPFAQMGFGFPVGFQPQGVANGQQGYGGAPVNAQPQNKAQAQAEEKGDEKEKRGEEREKRGVENEEENEEKKEKKRDDSEEKKHDDSEENVESERKEDATQKTARVPADGSVVYEQQKQPEAVDSEFDFDSNNAKFQEVERKEQGDSAKEDSEQFYNKKNSFFDKLSTSTQDSERDRVKWSAEREKNMDTFGEASTYRGGRGRGRGRGRGYGYRGGRGSRGYGYGYGYRGRGRGRGRGNGGRGRYYDNSREEENGEQDEHSGDSDRKEGNQWSF